MSSLPEHLVKYWGGRQTNPLDNPAFCLKQSKRTPAIPWHNGTRTCLACGKSQ